MKYLGRVVGLLLIAIVGLSFFNDSYQPVVDSRQSVADSSWVCLPCGSACDNTIYDKPGICSHCNMKLVKKETIKFKSIDPGDICSFIDAKGKENVLLLDVRTAREFNGEANDKFGRLKNAINIPVQELEKRMDELKQYKNREIIVYCSHSHRSPQASYLLNQNGFTKVTNMNYGMSEWKNKVSPNGCSNKIYVNQQ